MRRFLAFAAVMVIFSACGVNRTSFSPAEKYSPAALQKDYAIYREILEDVHPSLYWYDSKDSMQQYFNWGQAQLTDSLNESDFRKILSYVTAKINCGHTSIRPSKNYIRYQDTARIFRAFPLSLKIWDDTAVVATNLNRRDTILKRGTVITAINGTPMGSIADSLFRYISGDGYNRTHKYQTLSNRGYFGSLYSAVFGYPGKYSVSYLDSQGHEASFIIHPYYPGADTTNRSIMRPPPRLPQPSRKERRNMRRDAIRQLSTDATNHTAVMDLNSFGQGYQLKSFFRQSFRTLRKKHISHLIIDVRNNGGGNVTNSIFLTRFLANDRFKVADSLYAVTKRKEYSRYIHNDFLIRLFMTFFTRRQKDGFYHFNYFERHYFKRKKKNHFSGKTYILTGGNSFSATTLFTGSLIRQENVTVLGEETGGGAYGNSAWLIPDVTLPETKVRFRLPLFRLVIDKSAKKNGRGIMPEIFTGPTVDAIRRGADYKMEKVVQLIKQDEAAAKK